MNYNLGTFLQLSNNVPIDQLYDDHIDMTQYVGWDLTSSWNGLVRQLFTKRTVALIRKKVSDFLQGVDMKGRRIYPSDNVVITALWGIFQNYQPNEIGDIYGRYLVVNPNRDDYTTLVDQTISFLSQSIKNDIEMSQNNEKLSVWDTILGDFNSQGLRSHPILYMKEKRPDPFLISMRY